ncbi:hypothetical protein PEBR_33900 [Penicillium brasilianum]|uniref:T6SS Phospholipase effector Tle1-like catalytic domain-containing protein n=1 Tax=Penicillium brasilianum TaxID=104259 RepID=A0A1S9RGR7_PENBI|nr:hypothetical protein PEBR_33900 [Penicillium brasilianum]
MGAVDISELLGDEPLRQREDTKLTPVRKRIIICCDGTWQSAVSGKKNVPSNVTRLCRSLNPVGTDKDGNQWQQVVWYDSGVGTTALALGDAFEGATGAGMETNIIEAYNFAVLNYNPGDKIMCFGFSRGAYTARTIAGLISDIGICQKTDLNKFPDLWAVYKKLEPGKRFHRSELWFDWMWGKADENQGAGDKDHREFVYEKAPQGDWAQEGSREVEVVGVYDTVGALGMPEVLGIKLPSSEGWHNVGLSPNIPNAFQCLALDERRKAFSPTLWYLNKKTATKEQVEAHMEDEKLAEKRYWDVLQHAKDLKASGGATDEAVNAAAREVNVAARAWNKAARKRVRYQNRLEQHPVLRQVWIPGFHINIGGGSNDTLKDEGDMENMSNIAFAWMLDQIKDHVSVNEQVVSDEQNDRERHIEELNLQRRKTDLKLTSTKPKPQSLVKRTVSFAKTAVATISLPFKAIQQATEEKAREIGWGTGILEDSFTLAYWLNGQKRRTPGEYAKDNGNSIGETCEYIHPVVNFRVNWFKEQNEKDSSHPIYKPIHPKLKYERRKVVGKDGKPFFEYEIGGCLKPLPEWKLGGLDSYERLAIAGKAAYDYVDKLDEELETGIRTIRRSAISPKKPPVESALATVSDFDLKKTANKISTPSVGASTADETVTGTYCRDTDSKL